MLGGFITSTRSINGIINSTVMVSNSIISNISNNANSMDIIASMIIINSTTSNTIQNATISLLHPTNNVNVTTEVEQPGKSVNKNIMLLASVFGGLLGLCLLMCIVGLVTRSKHKKKRNKLKAGKFSSAHFNPLFHR